MNRKSRGFRIGTVVRHFKGSLYRIEDFARHTETGELMVIYRQCFPPFMLLARPESIFCSRVDSEKYPLATQEWRFEAVTKVEAMGGRRREAPPEMIDERQDLF